MVNSMLKYYCFKYFARNVFVFSNLITSSSLTKFCDFFYCKCTVRQIYVLHKGWPINDGHSTTVEWSLGPHYIEHTFQNLQRHDLTYLKLNPLSLQLHAGPFVHPLPQPYLTPYLHDSLLTHLRCLAYPLLLPWLAYHPRWLRCWWSTRGGDT